MHVLPTFERSVSRHRQPNDLRIPNVMCSLRVDLWAIANRGAVAISAVTRQLVHDLDQIPELSRVRVERPYPCAPTRKSTDNLNVFPIRE
jgi:hypothetical protein